MASARYGHSSSGDDDQREVQSAINKAMQAWIRDNPEDEDNMSPSRPKQRKISYVRSSAGVPGNVCADDGTMRCNLCDAYGFTKNELRQHLNRDHTGGYQYYCTLCTKRFRFNTTYQQHMLVDHKDMDEDATFDRRTGHGFDKAENQSARNQTSADQAEGMEVVLEEEVVTESQAAVVAPSAVEVQQGQTETETTPAPPAVNGDVNHVVQQQATYEEIVHKKPMPEPPRIQRRLEPVEQNVLISPTLQSPKRRVNYTGIRSPAKQIRQEGAEETQVFKFRCNLCPTVEFPDKESVTAHFNSCHTGDNRYYCKFCTRRFLIKANYENHLELDHGRDKFGRELPKKQTTPKPVAQRKPQAKNTPTIRVGTSKQVILTDTLHDPSVDVVIDTETVEDRKQAQDKIQKAYQAWLNNRDNKETKSAEKRLTCPICDVALANKFKLEKHMLGHANPSKVMPKVRKCYHCDRVFQEGLQLERHVDAYHTHRCPKCDRVFNNLGDRDLHLVVAHARKKSGKKSEIIDEEEEDEPEVPSEAHVTPRPRGRPRKVETPSDNSSQKETPVKSAIKAAPAKSAIKATPAKSAQKTPPQKTSSKKRAASPEPRPKMTPKKFKVQLINKKRGRPKKVVAVKGKSAKVQPAKKSKPTKKSVQPAKKTQPAKKAQPAAKKAAPSAKSTPKGKVYKVEGRSAVWEYFGFYMSGSQYLKDVAVCLICGAEKSYSSDGSTASMRGHIQHQHSDIWSKKFTTPKKSGKKK